MSLKTLFFAILLGDFIYYGVVTGLAHFEDTISDVCYTVMFAVCTSDKEEDILACENYDCPLQGV